ncbi:MAG TPA: type VI secretion system baseplate subunit TssG [Gemmatimonadaceae bacterium]|jgi:type VI secretion system protein ImpH
MAAESGLEAAALKAPPAYVPPVAAGTDDVALATGADASADAQRLLDRMLAEPWSFEFFQAMHLLERLQPDRSPVGEFADPRQEFARLTTTPSVAFPASEIQSLESRNGQPRMAVNFLGLTGPQGMLPLAYSLYVAERVRAGDHALKDFLGIFDHRVLSLFYRAWEKTHVGVSHGQGSRDWLTRALLDLVGFGSEAFRNRLPMRDEALLFYAGLLSVPSRPAAALEQMLADFFGVPVAIEQFVGAWYPLERASQSELGDDESASAQLGLGAVAGDEIWDQQSRARVRVGPLSRKQYDEFLPGGSAYAPLRALTRLYTNDLIDFEIQLVLDRKEVPPFQLGDDTLPLSWCTWLATKPLGRNPDDTVFMI